MKLIVGLGNPGANYIKTRHNVGFWCIEEIAKFFNIPIVNEKRFFSLTGKGVIERENVLLLMPQTFMNLSGRAVVAASSYYKIPLDNIIVIYDDLDIFPGNIKLKLGGSAAGHNGIKNIIQMLSGNSDFYRIRLGIGRPNREDIVPYVLGAPSNQDKDNIFDAINKVTQNFPMVLNDWMKAQGMLNKNTQNNVG